MVISKLDYKNSVTFLLILILTLSSRSYRYSCTWQKLSILKNLVTHKSYCYGLKHIFGGEFGDCFPLRWKKLYARWDFIPLRSNQTSEILENSENSKFQFSNIWFNLPWHEFDLILRGLNLIWLNYPTSHWTEILHSLIFIIIISLNFELFI